jgi:acyl-coenzyme A thioesterase PaaI-like protein
MKQNTHPAISDIWVGKLESLSPNEAKASLGTREEMCADQRGLIHGGFTFGLADYAAMLAVNDPHVVLGASECKFLAPVRLGETMEAHAVVKSEKGKKRNVEVNVDVNSERVFEGIFTCFVLDQHVLD